jgi:hypothetical protein
MKNKGHLDFEFFHTRVQPRIPSPYLLLRTATVAANQRKESPMDTALFVPIAMFACIAYSIKAVVDARVRKQLVSSNGSPELVAKIMQNDEANRRLSSLRWGVTLLALAAGFGIVEAMGWTEVNPGAIAVLIGALGLGNLATFAVTRKLG